MIKLVENSGECGHILAHFDIIQNNFMKIEFGTVYQATYDPERANGKYIVTEVGIEWIGSGYLDETGDVLRLNIPGSHPISDVKKVLRTMSFEEVLQVIENRGWLDKDVEKFLRKEKEESKQVVI